MSGVLTLLSSPTVSVGAYRSDARATALGMDVGQTKPYSRLKKPPKEKCDPVL